MIITASNTVARSIVGALGALVLATTFIAAATGPAQAAGLPAAAPAPIASVVNP